jgi:hypothetical protein
VNPDARADGPVATSVDFRIPSVPKPDSGSTTALIFALLTTLFLADAVKQAVVLWQYRR